MKNKFFFVSLITAVLLVSLCTPSKAASPIERVRNMLEIVMTIQTDPQLQGDEFRQKRRFAIKKIIGENFDFDTMASRALCQYWQYLNAAQQSEFKSVFRDLFQDSYTRLVLNFLKREKIVYTNENINEAQASVQTSIVRANDEIPINYFLAPVDKVWLVHDVEIDGISIVKNYRKSFTRVIKRESYESLLQKMLLQQQTIEETP